MACHNLLAEATLIVPVYGPVITLKARSDKTSEDDLEQASRHWIAFLREFDVAIEKHSFTNEDTGLPMVVLHAQKPEDEEVQ